METGNIYGPNKKTRIKGLIRKNREMLESAANDS